MFLDGKIVFIKFFLRTEKIVHAWVNYETLYQENPSFLQLCFAWACVCVEWICVMSHKCIKCPLFLHKSKMQNLDNGLVSFVLLLLCQAWMTTFFSLKARKQRNIIELHADPKRKKFPNLVNLSRLNKIYYYHRP